MMRSSNQRSREFRISSSRNGPKPYSRGGSKNHIKVNINPAVKQKHKINVAEPRLEAFTPKLEANAMRDGEILKNYGEFGESESNFMKREDD